MHGEFEALPCGQIHFQRAKTILLENLPAINANPMSPFVEEQLAQVRIQNELERIDREWEIERRQYQIIGRYGRSFIPTIGTGISTAIVGGLFGIFWTVTALTITNATSHFGIEDGPFSIINTFFPLIGILITITAIWRGIYCCLLAQNHNVAYQAYQQRRLKVSSAD